MRTSLILVLTFVAVLQTFSIGLAKETKGKEHEKDAKESTVKEGDEPTKEVLLKTAPLGFGIGLKTNVPETNVPETNVPETATQKTEKDGNAKSQTKIVTKTKRRGDTVITTKITKTLIPETGKWETVKVEKTITNGKNFDVGKLKKSGFMLDLFNPFKFGMFADEPAAQCSSKKHCKKPGMYCDKMDNQCRKKVKLDGRCDQAGQCDSEENKHVACLWGRCSLVTQTVGYAGLFCKDDKDCQSEELHCASQPDISEVSKVCIYKPAEGQTCGRRSMFNLFSFGGETRDLPCKNGLTCVQLGFSNRKICRRSETLNDDDKHENKASEDEDEE